MARRSVSRSRPSHRISWSVPATSRDPMRDASASLIGRFTGEGPVEWRMRARAASVSSEFPKGDDASSISPAERASLVNNP